MRELLTEICSYQSDVTGRQQTQPISAQCRMSHDLVRYHDLYLCKQSKLGKLPRQHKTKSTK